MQEASFENVRDFILTKVGRAAGADANDLHLLNAGVLDSIGFVNLIAAIEEQFGIEIDLGDADPDEFLTVNGLAQCASRSAQSSAASNDA